MAAITICSVFGAQKNKVWHCFHCFPIYFPWSGPDAMIFVFWMLSFKPPFSLSTFTFIKRLLSSSSLSAIRVVSSSYLRLFLFLPAILIPTCVSSSPAFLKMYSIPNKPPKVVDIFLFSGCSYISQWLQLSLRKARSALCTWSIITRTFNPTSPLFKGEYVNHEHVNQCETRTSMYWWFKQTSVQWMQSAAFGIHSHTHTQGSAHKH